MKIGRSPEISNKNLRNNRIKLTKVPNRDTLLENQSKKSESNLLSTIIEEHQQKFGFSRTYDEFAKESKKNVKQKEQPLSKKIPFSYIREKINNSFKKGDQKGFFSSWNQLKKRSQIYVSTDQPLDTTISHEERLEFLQRVYFGIYYLHPVLSPDVKYLIQ